MPKINARTDVCIIKSVNFLQLCPKVTVPEAMIVGGFSEKEQQDCAKQAWIYHRWKRNPTGAMNNAPPPLLNIQINTAAVDNEEEPLSSVTSASGTLSDECKKAKHVQMTGSAAQSIRMA
jgi:hypothetical protein